MAVLQSSPRYSILVVGFKSLGFLENCFNSLLASEFQDFEILFLDNHSPQKEADFIEQRFSNLKISIFRSDKNLFFAGGNNYLANRAKGEYLILLNPDTTVDPKWLSVLDAFRLDHGLDAAQLDLRSMKDGVTRETAGCSIDRAGFIIHPPYIGNSSPMAIFSGRGAALVIRGDIYRKAEGLDEDFKMYFEETDLCWRIHLLGHSIAYVPASIVYHFVGGSSPKLSFLNINSLRFTRNRILTLLKNYEIRSLLIYLPLHYFIYLVNIVRGVLTLKMSQAYTDFLAILAPLPFLARVIKKRRIIQSKKKVSDRELLEKGLISRKFKHF